MNGPNPIFAAIVIIAGAIGGLFVTLSVLLSSGNTLAHLCFYLLVGGGMLGLLAPRVAFFVWIIACAYSDFLKRLTVVFGEVGRMDLMYVLGITPAMFSAIVVSLMIGGFTGAYQVRMSHWKLLILGLMLTLANGIICAIETGGSMQMAMQGIANGGLYSLMLFVMPVMFPRYEDTLRVLRFTLWVFLPVALYGIAQQIDGFQPFEIAYLRTGLSIEIKQLLTNHVRAFSTLNSPTALGTVSAVLVVICWFLSRLSRPAPLQHKRWVNRWIAMLMMPAYACALLASTSRSAPLLIVFGFAAGWCFLSPGRTLLFYSVVLSAFVGLVVASPWLLGHLDEANRWVTSGVENDTLASQMASVGTYSDRLFGFANVLSNPAAYSFFGRWDGNLDLLPESLKHHDIVSAMLLRFGIVPLLICIFGLASVLIRLHKELYGIDDPVRQRLMAMSIGLAAGLIFLSALSGNVLGVFPVNVFFWMSAGIALVCTLPVPTVAPRPEGARYTGLGHDLARRPHAGCQTIQPAPRLMPLRSILRSFCYTPNTIRYRVEWPRIAEAWSKIGEVGTLFDGGAGSGEFSRRALQNNFCRAVIALEYDAGNFRLLERNLGRDPRAKLMHGSVLEIPLPDRSVDMVMSTQVIEHIAEHGKAAAEFNRILRPGGHAIITTPHPPEPFPNDDHVREGYTEEDLRALFAPARMGPRVVRTIF